MLVALPAVSIPLARYIEHWMNYQASCQHPVATDLLPGRLASSNLAS
jgi:hypothetical protein